MTPSPSLLACAGDQARGLDTPLPLPPAAQLRLGQVWHAQEEAQWTGCPTTTPSTFPAPTPSTTSSLDSLTAQRHPRLPAWVRSLSREPPGSATEALGSGTESRGWLGRERREPAGARTETGQREARAAVQSGRSLALRPQGRPPACGWCSGADTVMRQAVAAPTVADAPQGSLD